MKFRLLGAVALSLISSAAAAAVVRVDLMLEYVGRHYSDVEVYDNTSDLIRDIAHLDEVDDVWGLERATPDFFAGQQLRFQADFHEDERIELLGYAQGCQLDRYLNCSDWMVGWDNRSGFEIARDLSDSNNGYFIVGSAQVGSTFSLKAASSGSRWAFHDSLSYVYVGDEYANFRVVLDNMAVAPVPLPASAALLPIGFGALSLLRRRRRHKTAGSAS